VIHEFNERWLYFAFAIGAALALWALAAVYGYAWQTIWLPAAVAGAAWPSRRSRMLDECLRRLQRDRKGGT
jgi:hypothetical protein